MNIYRLPFDDNYELTTPFGVTNEEAINQGWTTAPPWVDGYHTGCDYGLPLGTIVRTMAPGTARFTGHLPVRRGKGLVVEVDHGDGLTSRYCHLSTISVMAGQKLEMGEIIGCSGATGYVTGPHLHWEVLLNGSYVDPLFIIDQEKDQEEEPGVDKDKVGLALDIIWGRLDEIAVLLDKIDSITLRLDGAISDMRLHLLTIKREVGLD